MESKLTFGKFPTRYFLQQKAKPVRVVKAGMLFSAGIYRSAIFVGERYSA
jgi:hypothetical protein